MLKQLLDRVEFAVLGTDAEMRDASRAMLAELKTRVENIETRLAAIETHLGIEQAPVTTIVLNDPVTTIVLNDDRVIPDAVVTLGRAKVNTDESQH